MDAIERLPKELCDVLLDSLERFSDAFIVLDREYRFVFMNSQAEQLLQRKREELLGRNVWEEFPEAVHTTLYEAYRQAADQQVPVTVEDYYTPLRRSIELRVFPTRQGITGFLRDITERRRREVEIETERQRLRTLLDTLPVGVFIANADGKIVEVNDLGCEIWGGEVPLCDGIPRYAEYKGSWADTGQPLEAKDWALARALTRGETSIGEVINIQRFDGTQGTILNSAAPTRDTEGHITGAVVVIQDVTENERLRRELKDALEETRRDREEITALCRVAEVGITMGDFSELLNALAEQIAKGMGSHSCTIMVLDEQAEEFEAKAAYNIPGSCGVRFPMYEGLPGKVYAECRTIYVADAEHDPLIEDPHLKGKGIKSILAVPLIARSRFIGVVFLDEERIREYTEREVLVFELMASRAAQSLENSILYSDLQLSHQETWEALQREREFSLMLQRALLPEEPLAPEGYRLAHIYIPAYAGREIGGDFYDFFTTETGQVGMLIGDVSGKGLEAAHVGAATRSTIRAFAYELPSSADAMTHANRVLYHLQPRSGWSFFVTVTMAHLDVPTGRIRYCSAGHPPAAIYRTATGKVELLPMGDPPVGLVDAYEFHEYRFHLNPGDKVVFYTDGISEARADGELFGTEGIERILAEHGRKSPEQIVNILLTAATNFAEGQLRDDTVIIAIERLAE